MLRQHHHYQESKFIFLTRINVSLQIELVQKKHYKGSQPLKGHFAESKVYLN